MGSMSPRVSCQLFHRAIVATAENERGSSACCRGGNAPVVGAWSRRLQRMVGLMPAICVCDSGRRRRVCAATRSFGMTSTYRASARTCRTPFGKPERIAADLPRLARAHHLYVIRCANAHDEYGRRARRETRPAAPVSTGVFGVRGPISREVNVLVSSVFMIGLRKQGGFGAPSCEMGPTTYRQRMRTLQDRTAQLRRGRRETTGCAGLPIQYD